MQRQTERNGSAEVINLMASVSDFKGSKNEM